MPNFISRNNPRAIPQHQINTYNRKKMTFLLPKNNSLGGWSPHLHHASTIINTVPRRYLSASYKVLGALHIKKQTPHPKWFGLWGKHPSGHATLFYLVPSLRDFKTSFTVNCVLRQAQKRAVPRMGFVTIRAHNPSETCALRAL